MHYYAYKPSSVHIMTIRKIVIKPNYKKSAVDMQSHAGRLGLGFDL